VKAFEDIYNTNKDDVYRFLCKLTNYQFSLAEELLQETFYQAFLSFDRFRGECSIRTWLCQIAKNTYYTHLKKEIRKEHLVRKLEPPASSGDFTDRYEKREMLQNIHAILEDFEERDRSIVLYRMYADITFREIACLLGIKESSAKVIYSRAKAKIQQQLKERFDYEI